MTSIVDADYLKQVREQYENYPYPYRDPELEKQRLLATYVEHLDKINFYCFGGKRDFNNFRFLEAGCGTGDGVIYIAEQLREMNADIYAIDISEASLNIVKERAKIRGLDNITFIHNSLLELPKLKEEIGEFDYVNCSGVLHHLEDPDLGLQALKSVLKKGGALSLMVYGQYGRTAIYHVQELMRMINAGEENLQVQVENTKAILDDLPSYNWFSTSLDLINDVKTMGDIGIYDLFLHTQDRAYTIDQLYDYAENAGLQIIDFGDWKCRYWLNPLNYIKDSDLANKISSYSHREQYAIGELIFGAQLKHMIYLAPQIPTRPSIDDQSYVPYLYNHLEDRDHSQLAQGLNTKGGQELELTEKGITVKATTGPYAKYIFKHMDGNNDTKTICNLVKRDTGGKAPIEDIFAELKYLYNKFSRIEAILLKAPGVPRFKKTKDLQIEMTNRMGYS